MSVLQWQTWKRYAPYFGSIHFHVPLFCVFSVRYLSDFHGTSMRRANPT